VGRFGESTIRPDAPPPVEAAIATLAARQHGVVSLAQLGELGVGARVVQLWAARGRLHRLHRGVYAVGHVALTADARRLAAVLACGREAVLSHGTAAVVWGIRTGDGVRIDVTTSRRTGRTPPTGVRLHRTRRLTPDDHTLRDGLPTTTLERTLVDLAAVLTPHRLERALHEAEVLRLLDVRALTDTIERHPGRRGTTTLARLVAAPTAGPTRSELESAFLALCRVAPDLPQPRLNVHLHGHEVDALFADHRVVVELDGAAAHHTRRAFHADRRRDSRLAAHGYLTVRLTHDRVTREPDATAAELAPILGRARA
jgi:uncharacterized protein DUF559/putative AbiEi antitoxin of type IV toxin-antitoxin system